MSFKTKDRLTSLRHPKTSFYSLFDDPVVDEGQVSFDQRNLRSLYNISVEYFCKICDKLLRDPCQMICGCRACLECIKYCMSFPNYRCPTTECDGKLITEYFRDKAFDREMTKAAFKCINNECTETVLLFNFYEHRAVCQFSFVSCRNCDEHVQIREKEHHNLNECGGFREESDQDQDPFMKEIREMMSDMLEEIERLKTHQKEQWERISNFENKQKESEYTVASLRSTINDLNLNFQSKYISNQLTLGNFTEFVWRISDFSSKQKQTATNRPPYLISAPYLTGEPGYKICLRVYPNGDGQGKGTHLSVFMVLLHGKYDSLLKWPFPKLFTISLLNQNNGHNIIYKIKPDPESECFKRPKNKANKAIGNPTFIRLDSLTNDYLKDDTLFVKFEIKN